MTPLCVRDFCIIITINLLTMWTSCLGTNWFIKLRSVINVVIFLVSVSCGYETFKCPFLVPVGTDEVLLDVVCVEAKLRKFLDLLSLSICLR